MSYDRQYNAHHISILAYLLFAFTRFTFARGNDDLITQGANTIQRTDVCASTTWGQGRKASNQSPAAAVAAERVVEPPREAALVFFFFCSCNKITESAIHPPAIFPIHPNSPRHCTTEKIG